MKIVTTTTIVMELTRNEYRTIKNMKLHDKDIIVDGYSFHRSQRPNGTPGWSADEEGSNGKVRHYLGDINGLRSRNGMVSITISSRTS